MSRRDQRCQIWMIDFARQLTFLVDGQKSLVIDRSDVFNGIEKLG